MTLTEFLLARIAEDETAAERAGSFTPWEDTFQNDNYGHLTVQPVRVLAECEAKRRIVERVTDDAALYDTLSEIDPHDLEDYTSGAIWGLTFALRSLAAAYADHPDYLDEWKVPADSL